MDNRISIEQVGDMYKDMGLVVAPEYTKDTRFDVLRGMHHAKVKGVCITPGKACAEDFYECGGILPLLLPTINNATVIYEPTALDLETYLKEGSGNNDDCLILEKVSTYEDDEDTFTALYREIAETRLVIIVDPTVDETLFCDTFSIDIIKKDEPAVAPLTNEDKEELQRLRVEFDKALADLQEKENEVEEIRNDYRAAQENLETAKELAGQLEVDFKELNDKEAFLTAKEKELREREEKLSNKEEELIFKVKELENREQELKNKEEDLAAKEVKFSDRENDQNSKMEELEAREKAISTKEVDLMLREQELTNRELELDRRPYPVFGTSDITCSTEQDNEVLDGQVHLGSLKAEEDDEQEEVESSYKMVDEPAAQSLTDNPTDTEEVESVIDEPIEEGTIAEDILAEEAEKTDEAGELQAEEVDKLIEESVEETQAKEVDEPAAEQVEEPIEEPQTVADGPAVIGDEDIICPTDGISLAYLKANPDKYEYRPYPADDDYSFYMILGTNGYYQYRKSDNSLIKL